DMRSPICDVMASGPGGRKNGPTSDGSVQASNTPFALTCTVPRTSGRIVRADDVIVLLVSSTSGTRWSTSTMTCTTQMPGGMSTGTFTAVAAVETAPGPSRATVRPPTRRGQSPSVQGAVGSTSWPTRKISTLNGPAADGVGATFFTVVTTEMVWPTMSIAGAVTAVSCRSGRTMSIGAVATRALLVSSSSGSASASSTR